MNNKKKWIIACIAAAVILGAVWFVLSHTFIDGKIYANNAKVLDIRGSGASAEHYEAVREAFPDVQILWDVPFQGAFLLEDSKEVSVTTLTDEDVATLDYLTALQTVDARGCTDYPQLKALIQRRPEVNVLYTVTIDGKDYDQDAATLHLKGFTDQELTLVQYLPKLTSVQAVDCKEYDLLLALQQDYPQLQVAYQVPIDGKMYPEDTASLHLTAASTTELMDNMKYLTQLDRVSLLDPDCDGVTMTELVEAYPNIDFYWEKDVLGITVTSQDTQLDISRQKPDSIPYLEQEMKNFPNLERLYLGRCGLDNEELAAYRDRVRSEYKVVWNILIGALFVDTDETWFMPGKYDKGVTEEQAKLLKYCEEMVCIDVGHKPLETCEFVRYMPNLKYLILADTNIEDLTPLSTCKNLVFLELFLCFAKDYTPLLGCTALEDLNLGYTWGDPEPIKQMTWLKRLWWVCQEDLEAELTAALPNTELMLVSSNSSVAWGWRQGQRYYEMRDIFGLHYMW